MITRQTTLVQGLFCILAVVQICLVVWLAIIAGTGGYTGHLRSVLIIQVIHSAMLSLLTIWLVIISTRQHRELRKVAFRAAASASHRKSDQINIQIKKAAESLSEGAHELAALLQTERNASPSAILLAIAAKLNIDVVAPVPPPGASQ